MTVIPTYTCRMTQIAHLDLTIKAARANQCLIQDVCTVRRGNHHLTHTQTCRNWVKDTEHHKRTPPGTTLYVSCQVESGYLFLRVGFRFLRKTCSKPGQMVSKREQYFSIHPYVVYVTWSIDIIDIHRYLYIESEFSGGRSSVSATAPLLCCSRSHPFQSGADSPFAHARRFLQAVAVNNWTDIGQTLVMTYYDTL